MTGQDPTVSALLVARPATELRTSNEANPIKKYWDENCKADQEYDTAWKTFVNLFPGLPEDPYVWVEATLYKYLSDTMVPCEVAIREKYKAEKYPVINWYLDQADE